MKRRSQKQIEESKRRLQAEFEDGGGEIDWGYLEGKEKIPGDYEEFDINKIYDEQERINLDKERSWEDHNKEAKKKKSKKFKKSHKDEYERISNKKLSPKDKERKNIKHIIYYSRFIDPDDPDTDNPDNPSESLEDTLSDEIIRQKKVISKLGKKVRFDKSAALTAKHFSGSRRHVVWQDALMNIVYCMSFYAALNKVKDKPYTEEYPITYETNGPQLAKVMGIGLRKAKEIINKLWEIGAWRLIGYTGKKGKVMVFQLGKHTKVQWTDEAGANRKWIDHIYYRLRLNEPDDLYFRKEIKRMKNEKK